MEPVSLILVGCGMMGARHLRGYGELLRTMPGSLRLSAVCDARPEMAEKVAAEAEALLGYRPQVFTDLKRALDALPGLEAADLVTDPRSHDGLAGVLFEGGLHVICEKPMAPTIARGKRMVDAARKCGRLLAEAENNRRDPMTRLAKASLEAGLIGTPNLVLQSQVSRGGGILATTWRHRLAMGGVLLDVPVHMAYVLEHLMGPLQSVYAQTQLVQRVREGKDWAGNQVRVDVDAEDVFSAVLTFVNGAQGSWTANFASPGETVFKRVVYGSEGTLSFPSERTGVSPEVRRGNDVLAGADLVARLPGYQLNEVETKLFGERPSGYKLEGPVVDRKLQAAQMYDLVEAIRTGRPVETDGNNGLHALASIYAIMESGLAGVPVSYADVLSGKVHAYQDRVEAANQG